MDQPSARVNEQPPKARKQGVVRDLFGKLALLTVSTGVCLLVLEYIVRALLPFFNPKAQIPFHATEDNFFLGPISRQIRQATPKGDYDVTVSFNQYGFRDTKNLRESSERDIFVVGDSFSMGWGVEQSQRYSNLLEKKLGRRVFNISIPEDIRGYSKLVKYAEKCGAKVRNLIIGLCVENDLRDYSNGKTSVELFKDQQYLKASYPLGDRMRGWFWSHSALYIAASYTIQKSSTLRHLLESIGVARNIDRLIPNNKFNEQTLASSRDELVNLASNYNSVILIIPSRALWHGNKLEEEKKVHERLVQLLRQAGLHVVDLKPEFERGGHPLSNYFSTDPHWNPSGHSAAADALFEYFQSHQTQPSDEAHSDVRY